MLQSCHGQKVVKAFRPDKRRRLFRQTEHLGGERDILNDKNLLRRDSGDPDQGLPTGFGDGDQRVETPVICLLLRQQTLVLEIRVDPADFFGGCGLVEHEEIRMALQKADGRVVRLRQRGDPGCGTAPGEGGGTAQPLPKRGN